MWDTDIQDHAKYILIDSDGFKKYIKSNVNKYVLCQQLWMDVFYTHQLLWTDVSLWEFQSLDEVKTLIYMEVYILSRLLGLEAYFILNIVED